MKVALLCVEIFLCRILDVSCCTMRTVLTVKEKTALAALVGFFEAFLWFVIVRQALNSEVTGLPIALAYGGGFAAGTFVGGKLAMRLIRSNVVMEVVTTGKNDELIHSLQGAGFAVTVVDARATAYGPEKYLLLSEIGDRRLKEFKTLVYTLDPKAFIMVQETKYVFNGFMRKGE
ncbi:MAG: DUF5698 domain-containing protein [Oscillospiraceae bacterium]